MVPTPNLGDELYMDPGAWVGVLQVIDELGQVFDGVYIVVRWWRDQLDTRCGVAHPSNIVVHFVSWQLASLTRLGTLGHLYLEVLRVDQIVAGDPETPGGHLLDSAAPRVPVGVGGIAVVVFSTSPVLLLAPIRFIAIARVSCASLLIEPRDIAPVANRFTISEADSTSSRE